MLDNCYRAYKRAVPENKRRWNQVMFEAIYVRDRKIVRVAFKEPFNTLLGAGPGDAGSISDCLVGLTGVEPVAIHPGLNPFGLLWNEGTVADVA